MIQDMKKLIARNWSAGIFFVDADAKISQTLDRFKRATARDNEE